MEPTVLIVDDEHHIRLLIEQALEDLEDQGVELLTASNGEEALDVITSVHPSLIFLDVMMPKMNGFDVCHAVKHDLGLRDTYVILLTAKSQEFDRQRGIEAGADMYLTKPFDPDQLLEKTLDVLGLQLHPTVPVRSETGDAAQAGSSVTQINFPKLITRDKEVSSLVAALLSAMPDAAGVTDAAGTLLMGHDGRSREEHPLLLDGEVIGRVVGDGGAAVVASVLAYILEREAEKRSLARDALDKYRELNLLYELSEKIGASLELQTVATIAVNEACRRIKAGTGFVLVLDDASGTLEPIASPEEAPLLTGGIRIGEGIIGQVAQSGRSEVVVVVDADPRRSEPERAFRSLVCAPLKARQRVIGVLAIGSAEPVDYTAADLKFLSTIASQAAPAIDHALLYERTVREARERERQLQQQVAELRIEVDQARQSQQVAEITGTDYFKALREQATDLRKDLQSSA